MCHQAYNLHVCVALGGRNGVGDVFDDVERLLYAAVYEISPEAPQHVAFVEAYGGVGAVGHLYEALFKLGECLEHGLRRGVHELVALVESFHYYTHRRLAGKQAQEMALLLQGYALVAHMFHHCVEHINQ